MLQRAASNSYSWWWASHVRTKQSKWLDQSLQDMEDKVADTLKILDDDGDSFAQRAEMYYKKRPELVNFVEESFRAYRSLADRYDHLSKELQSANRTIASVFPEQVQYRIEEDSEEESEAGSKATSPHPNNDTHRRQFVPKVPKIPKKDFRSPSMLLSRKGPLKRTGSTGKHVSAPISGLTKAEALEEIDKFQKDILALQTEKEFVRSLYERAYEKYWDIEDQITASQKRVSSLQDEFGVGAVIEDDDARALMAATALKSCKETLAKLQEIQAQSSKEAKVEYERVKKAHEMFETLRDQFISKYMSKQDKGGSASEEIILDQEVHDDVGLLREKIKEKLQEDSGRSITVAEMAERIDALVNKVVTLETAVSSQAGLVKRLRSETDELQENIRRLEEDKEMLIQGSEVTKRRLKELEEELRRVKALNQSVRSQDNSLQTRFTEASCNLEHLSGKLNDMKPDAEEENSAINKKKKLGALGGKPEKEFEGSSYTMSANVKELDDAAKEGNKSILRETFDFAPERMQKLIQRDKDDLSDVVSVVDLESQDSDVGDEEQPNWRQMFISGLDDREKILLEEYTLVLRNYKDVRVRLNDVEKKNRDNIFELALELRELKNALVNKDKEINYLHQKLKYQDPNPDESPYTTTTEYKYTPHEALLREAAQGTNPHGPETSPLATSDNANAARTPFAEQNNESTGDTDLSSVRTTLEKLMASHNKKHQGLSTLEKKLRLEIDHLLEENLEFWLRFSTSVHQIQKFQNSIQDLKAELRKIKERSNRSEGHHSKQVPVQSQLRPIFRHLREIRTELSLWLEHNAVLRDELQGRHSGLCSIQDQIAREGSAEALSGYQAAKFQGEVINMKQENSKVSSELQAGLGLVKGMKNDVEEMLDELDRAIGIGNTKRAPSRARIPLKSFLFGVKLKKQKQQSSLFACVNPAVHKHYSDMEPSENAPM